MHFLGAVMAIRLFTRALLAAFMTVLLAAAPATAKPKAPEPPVKFGVWIDRIELVSVPTVRAESSETYGRNFVLNYVPMARMKNHGAMPAPPQQAAIVALLPPGADSMQTWQVGERFSIGIFTDGPVCQANPRLFFILGETDMYVPRIAFEFVLLTKALVQKNCAPGVVRSVRLMALQAQRGAEHYYDVVGRVAWEGDVLAGQGFHLIHLDQQKFLAWQGQVAAAQTAARIKAIRDRRASTITGYCELYPDVCGAVLGVTALGVASGGLGGSAGGPDYPKIFHNSCMLDTGGNVARCTGLYGYSGP